MVEFLVISRIVLNFKGTSNENAENPIRKRQRSAVWSHFVKCNDQIAICLHCSKRYKTSGNTTNLSDHMKRMHPDLLNAEYVIEEVIEQQVQIMPLNRKIELHRKVLAQDCTRRATVQHCGRQWL